MFVFIGCNICWEIFIELCFLAVKYTECVEQKTCLGGRLLGAKGKTPTFHVWRRQHFFSSLFLRPVVVTVVVQA